jgi:hypothetical protein
VLVASLSHVLETLIKGGGTVYIHESYEEFTQFRAYKMDCDDLK